MKNHFQSKSVPRGTRTIWRYLGALLILFTFAIGNVMADEIFSWTATSALAKNASEDATGGTVTCTGSAFGSESPSGSGFYKFNSSTQLTCTLSSGTFAAGDVITFTFTSAGNNKTVGVEIQETSPVTSLTETIATKGTSVSKTYTVTASDGIQGQNKFSIKRVDSNFSLGGVSVTRSSGGGDPVCPETLTISSKDSKTAFTEGEKVELTASLAKGNGDITYQWYKGGTAEVNKLTGKTAAKLEIASCTTADEGSYYCVASKTSCSDAVNSSAFSITVEADTKCFNMPAITSKPSNLASVLVTGGTLSDVSVSGKTVAMDGNGLKFGGNDSRLKVTLTGASIIAGTKITVAWKGASAGSAGVGLFNENLASQVISVSGGEAAGSVSHTFTAEEAANYADEFIINRNASGSGICINAITVEDCGPAIVKHTVTLNYNDGETPNGSLTVVDGNAAVEPADPTRGKYTFLGWFVGDTDNEYVWSTAVTDDITLKAHWQDPWTITFDADGGSAVADITVKHNTKAEKPDDPTYASHDFEGWFIGDTDTPFDWDANVTANYSLKAHWIAEVAKYDIEYYDGETKIGTEEQVRADQHPTAAGISTDKPFYSFVGWFLTSELTGDPVALNTVTPSEGLKLYGKWTKVYAQDADLEDLVESEGTGADWQAYLSGKGYGFSTSNVTLDAKNVEKAHANWPYQGLKAKEVGAYVEGRIAADKLVIIKLGHMAAAANVTLDGVAAGTATGLDADEPAGQLNYFYAENEAVLRYETTNAGACVLKAITITNPFQVTFDANGGDDVTSLNGTPSVTLPSATKGTESFLGWFDGETKVGEAGESYTPTANITLKAHWEAISTDARLASIEFSAVGTLSPAFDPEVVNYTYTMPYGTVAVPQITGATAVNAGGSYSIVSQASAWDETAVIRGVAASSDTKAYNITMKIAPKDGVCLVWADVPADNTLTYNATNSKFYAESDVTLQNSNVKGKDGSAPSGKKFQSNGFLKIALNEGTFLEGDVVALNVTYGTANVMHVFKAQAATSADVIGEATGNTEAGLNKVAITEDASTLWLVRGGDFTAWNPHVDYVAVYRAMNPLLETLSINGKDADVSSTDITMELATSTDLNNLAIVETYISNDNSQVTTAVISNSGNWVEGENTYRVTDKDGDHTDYTITISLVTPAVAPTIETDLAASGTYEEYSSAALSIVASSPDGGTLSYQWYKDDVAIEGAVEASYNVSEEGTYKVIVKNSLSATNYATAISTACVMTVVMPSGCDELASIPSAEPYQYVQTDEWTLYSITSGGKLNTTNKFKNNAKNFADANVNAISDQRFALKFDKNVEHVDFYATASSTRTWNGSKAIQVTEDDIAGSTVAYTDVTANFTTDLTTIVPTGTRQYIFRATGIFEAGKTYWFAFNGGLDVFRICYAEALEKPVLPTLSDEDICEGGSFSEMSVASASVSEGTLSYQWYKDDEAIVGSEAATYQPTSAGTYYVVVTNSLLGRQPISAESNHAVLTASTSAVITTAPQDVRDDAGKPATLTVVAVGKNLHYAWKECATIDGTYTDVAGAADAASLEVTVPEGVKYYKVVVSSDCGGDVEAIAKVEEWVALTQVNVEGNTVWDWENAGENIKLTGETTPKKNEEGLMANIRVNGVSPTNDATFNSQALLFYGENVRAKDGGRLYASVGHISFRTTVQGIVSVEFSDNGTNNRRLSINGKLSESSTGKTDVKTFSAVVPAGDVVLMGVGPDGTGENQYIRISKIEFMKVDYTRDVTVGRLGTICLPNGGKMYGADLYEVAYFDASAKKIFFDEILSGEMEAGVPYVFLPNGKLDKLAVAYTDEVGAPAGNKNGLFGSFTQEALPTDGNHYILLNNQYCKVVEANTYVGANRAYLKIGVSGGVPTNPVAPAYGRRRISMGVTGENQAQGFENLQSGDQPMKVMIDGTLYIIRGEKVFDATGRLVK